MNLEKISPYCSALSLEAGEPLVATASQVSTYLLLEYNGSWGAKAFEESDLPEAVKVWASQLVKSLPAAKLRLIKTTHLQRKAGFYFYVAAAVEASPALYAFVLESYDALLHLDIPAVLAGVPQYASYRQTEPLLLVCTNGHRDRCCALHGISVYNALCRKVADESAPLVWQSTHAGGHRFAANLTCLPHGLLYGRVDAAAGLKILQTYRRGQVYLPNLRGRTCYTAPVQAADYFLRQQTEETALDAYRFLQVQETQPRQWKVCFESTHDGRVHVLEIGAELMDKPVYDSCWLDKTIFPTRYYLVNNPVVNK